MQDAVLKRNSSIRCVPAAITLSHAKAWAETAGISRVTDITRLDRIGLPVYAAIRPRAASDAVTYGKGLLPIDAQVGAYMEAIEFYFAEPSSGKVTVRWGTPREVAGGGGRTDAILDFNPILNRRINLDGPLLLAVGHDVDSGMECLLPAELVYHPAPDVGQRLFGSSTNGLASGNSVLEASLHALLEVIERDIWSFEFLRDSAQPVKPDSLPSIHGRIIEQARAAGLHFIVKYVNNHYGLPFFSVFLYENGRGCEKFFNGGWGCHYRKEIALTRALCEAAQSRLAVIHGARNFHANDPAPRNGFAAGMENLLSKPANVIAYSGIPDLSDNKHRTLEQQWRLLIDCLRRVTNMPVYRVIYTPPEAPLQVVRVIVPTLECFKKNRMRIGPRFKAAVEAL